MISDIRVLLKSPLYRVSKRERRLLTLGQTLGGIVGGMILIRDASDVAGISAQPLGWDVSDVGMHN